MTTPTSQREFALQVVRQLRDAGHEALWAGGCVRDQLLGRQPEDYDVATSARPAQVRELFGKRRTLAIGASFGVIAVLAGKGREPIEVATFRSDGAYLDGRHPSKVTYTDAEHDAQRRDFTINGLFFDPLAEQVIDYVGGQHDLEQGIVRAIGDPTARFAEDKLRMLRAVRFATTFDFLLDEPTRQAICDMASQLSVVSAERIGIEMGKILAHPQRARGVELLLETGLLRAMLPPLADLAEQSPPAWQQMIRSLAALQTDLPEVAWAALFYPLSDTKLVRQAGRELRMTNKQIDRAAWLVKMVHCVKEAPLLTWPQLQRVLVHDAATDLMPLATALWGRDEPGVALCDERLSWPAEKLNPPLLLTGDDLVAHGLTPGKYFAQLLEAVRDAQLEQEIETRDDAIEFVENWLIRHSKKQ